MYSEMQNKLSKTRESPLESMGQIISSRCPIYSCWFYGRMENVRLHIKPNRQYVGCYIKTVLQIVKLYNFVWGSSPMKAISDNKKLI